MHCIVFLVGSTPGHVALYIFSFSSIIQGEMFEKAISNRYVVKRQCQVSSYYRLKVCFVFAYLGTTTPLNLNGISDFCPHSKCNIF